jgi:branched-chain amino acid transport system substrate-binding protein
MMVIMPEATPDINDVKGVTPPPPVMTPNGGKLPPSPSKKLLWLVPLLLFVVAVVLAYFYLNKAPFSFLSLGGLSPAEQTKVLPKKPIKMGVILPLTGDSAIYGLPLQKATQLAQKEINAAGGINGSPLEIIWKDGKCQTQEASAAAETLINIDKVDTLIGGACSTEYLASAPFAQKAKLIVFSSAATSPTISTLGRYVFRTCPSDALAGRAAAEYAFKKWGARTAGIIYQDKDYPRALEAVFKKSFTALGGNVVLSEVFPSGTTDFSSYALKARELNPDVLYLLPQSPTPGVMLIQALKNQGVTSPLLTADAMMVRETFAEHGAVLEGLVGLEVAFDIKRPKTQQFLQAFKREYQEEPAYPNYMAGAYDIPYLVKEAFEKGGVNGDLAADYLYNLKNWPGASGDLTFDEHGDPTLPYNVIKVASFSGVLIDTITPSNL